MTTLPLNIAFSAVILAGAVLVALGARQRRLEKGRTVAPENVHLEFVESGSEGASGLDLEMGGEVLHQSEKKPFEPDKHQPDPLESLLKKGETPEN